MAHVIFQIFDPSHAPVPRRPPRGRGGSAGGRRRAAGPGRGARGAGGRPPAPARGMGGPRPQDLLPEHRQGPSPSQWHGWGAAVAVAWRLVAAGLLLGILRIYSMHVELCAIEVFLWSTNLWGQWQGK